MKHELMLISLLICQTRKDINQKADTLPSFIPTSETTHAHLYFCETYPSVICKFLFRLFLSILRNTDVSTGHVDVAVYDDDDDAASVWSER